MYIEEAIREAELKKLRSEIEKIDLEKREIEERITKKWWKIRAGLLIQTVIGGAVAGALVAGFGLDHFLKVIDLNKKSQQSLVLEKQELEDYQNVLIEDKKKLEEKSSKLAGKAQFLEVQQEKNREQIASLQNEKALLIATARKLRAERKRLSITSKTDQSIESFPSGPKYITDVWAFGVSESVVSFVRNYLLGKGYEVGFGGLLSSRADWLSLSSTVFFYHKDSEEIAKNIAKDLKEETGINFSTHRGAGLGVVDGEKKETFFVHIIQ